jgi:hypothetical protein
MRRTTSGRGRRLWRCAPSTCRLAADQERQPVRPCLLLRQGAAQPGDGDRRAGRARLPASLREIATQTRRPAPRRPRFARRASPAGLRGARLAALAPQLVRSTVAAVGARAPPRQRYILIRQPGKAPSRKRAPRS